jgi:hypothetical protein
MDRMTYVYIALVPMFILYMLAFYKKLRNDRLLTILLLITLFFGGLGMILKTPEASMFIGPFVYIGSYGLLRYAYLNKYKIEPTYNRTSWYDADEGRKQNWLDVITFVIPIVLSFILPLILVIAKSKGLF